MSKSVNVKIIDINHSSLSPDMTRFDPRHYLFGFGDASGRAGTWGSQQASVVAAFIKQKETIPGIYKRRTGCYDVSDKTNRFISLFRVSVASTNSLWA